MKTVISGNSDKGLEFFLEAIREDGIAIIKNGVSESAVREMLSFVKKFKYDANEEEEIKKRGMRLNNYAENIFNVATKRPDFLSYYTEGLVGGILKGCLNDAYYTSIPSELPNYILRNILARSSKEAMPYHIDSLIPYVGEYVSVMQVSIFLEKSDVERGCTSVALGSHQSGKYAPQSGFEPTLVEAEPGDIAIWDSRLWHATTSNVTNYTRWAMIGTFCRWYLKQGYDYPRALGQDVLDSLSLANQIVMGCAASVPLNEFEKTEVKGGIEHLKKHSRD